MQEIVESKTQSVDISYLIDDGKMCGHVGPYVYVDAITEKTNAIL